MLGLELLRLTLERNFNFRMFAVKLLLLNININKYKCGSNEAKFKTSLYSAMYYGTI